MPLTINFEGRSRYEADLSVFVVCQCRNTDNCLWKTISIGSNHDSTNGLRSAMSEGGALDATMAWLTVTEYIYDK